MSPLLIKISKDFATLFTTINPIATLALFAGLTASLSRADRHLHGAARLHLRHDHPRGRHDRLPGHSRRHWHSHALAQSGRGIILFLFGSQMLFGKMDEKPGSSPEEGRDLAVFPLAVPSIAGRGVIMAAIVLTDNDVYTVPGADRNRRRDGGGAFPDLSSAAFFGCDFASDR